MDHADGQSRSKLCVSPLLECSRVALLTFLACVSVALEIFDTVAAAVVVASFVVVASVVDCDQELSAGYYKSALPLPSEHQYR